jgi:glycosyltransferase involved in cell wall biosynthesis
VRDEELRRKLGEEGQKRVKECFPVERMLAKTNALYQELLR